MKQRIAVLLLVFAGGIIAFFLYYKYRVAPDVKVVDLPISELDGSPVDPQLYKGKTLFVNYWATWCGDCLREMPSIEQAYQQCDTNKVVFLMISDEAPERILNFLAKHHYPMKFVRLNKRTQELGVNTLPTTYV